MTQEMFLEFDDFKLEVLREKAYELDLNLEAYLSLMIEDMVSLNPRDSMTEPEKLMDKYIEKKWEKRIPVQPIIRFQEEYGDFINSSIQEYKEENPFGSKEDCINFVLKDLSLIHI